MVRLHISHPAGLRTFAGRELDSEGALMTFSGPQTSFEVIARELAEPLLHYLERYVGDRAVADDLRQETLLRVARGLASFDGRSAVKTWVFSIATRVAAEYFRDPGRRTQIVEMDEIAEPADPGQAIDERVVVGEMTACIREVIDSLPELYRAPLILHDLENLTAAQIADICECSVSAVKIRIHRARSRLRDALSKQCDFYRGDGGEFRCDRKTTTPST